MPRSPQLRNEKHHGQENKQPTIEEKKPHLEPKRLAKSLSQEICRSGAVASDALRGLKTQTSCRDVSELR